MVTCFYGGGKGLRIVRDLTRATSSLDRAGPSTLGCLIPRCAFPSYHIPFPGSQVEFMRVDLEQRLCDRADTAPANELLCCGSEQSAAVSHLSAGCSFGEILRNSGERWSGFLGIHLSASALQLCNLGGTAVSVPQSLHL